VSFHEEGLAYQLKKWVVENPLIKEAAIWEPDAGLELLQDQADPSVFQSAFDAKTTYPWENVWDISGELKPLESLEDPSILSLEKVAQRGGQGGSGFGYLAENQALIEYSGVMTRPYIGWMSRQMENGLAWLFWHQLAKDKTVRLFALDLDYLSSQALGVADSFVAGDMDVALAFSESQTHDSEYSQSAYLGDSFPGWYLRVSMKPGALQQESIILLSGGLVLGLFALLVAGGTTVIRKAYRGHQDALQKTTFVSVVSHELKTPITSIRMFADLLGEREVTPEKRVQYSDTISRESQRLTTLINNLLTYSSLEHGKKVYRYRDFDLVSLVEQTLLDYRRTIDAAGVEVTTRFPEASLEVCFDESAVKTVLINLIENVLKHAGDGGWIGLRIGKEKDEVFIEVSDRGPGIPRDQSEAIFQPFVQGENRLDKRKAGTGLGLSIARSMMRDCGGDLYLVKQAESGATFRITIRSRG
ncbi:MAG: HAMP domain-containing histidine kinase, partial [Verrucomicrobiae bacterium]|nr:HAMP domain-containing histidine kinase [Verrucomicrobiae bacterium]